jgi:hypothetical protein
MTIGPIPTRHAWYTASGARCRSTTCSATTSEALDLCSMPLAVNCGWRAPRDTPGSGPACQRSVRAANGTCGSARDGKRPATGKDYAQAPVSPAAYVTMCVSSCGACLASAATSGACATRAVSVTVAHEQTHRVPGRCAVRLHTIPSQMSGRPTPPPPWPLWCARNPIRTKARQRRPADACLLHVCCAQHAYGCMHYALPCGVLPGPDP